jgi:hypothetical protein
MYFGRLRLFVGIGLLFIPLGVVITGIQYLIFRVTGFSGLVDSAGSTNAVVDFLVYALGIFVTGFGLGVVQSATADAMVDIDAGRPVNAVAAYKKTVPKLGTLLESVLVAAVTIALVSFSAIGLLLSAWLLVRWAFIAQTIALENASWRNAMRRSAHLVRGNWWRVAALILFVTVVALLLGPLFGTLLLFVSHASFNFVNLISSVIYCLVVPFAAIATTYLYFDLRVEKQADELAAEAGDVLPVEAPSTALASH